MKNKRFGLAALLAVLIITVTGWTQTKGVQWEYKTAEITLNSSAEQKLNELGAQGWELVGAQARTFGGGTGNQMIYHFKRQK